MRRIAALVFVCTTAVTPIALAQTQGDSTQATAQSPSAVPCTPMKHLYSRGNWQDAHPLSGENPCPNPNAGKLKRSFFLYRAYRKVAPYRCLDGSEGFYAIPCYIIACESHFSWSAANSSGAVGPYQLLGWGAPYPAQTFRARLENHRIAAAVYAGGAGRSNWVC